jgi:hypothetical protein
MVACCQQIEGGERILYFGDSVVERVSRNDTDPTPLGQLVAQKLLPRYKTWVISHSAYRPEIYLALSRALESALQKPSMVILPINIRCFSPQWDWNPDFDFTREIRAIDRYHRDPEKKMIRLIPTNKIPVGFLKRQTFLHKKVHYPLSDCKRVRDFVAAIADKPKDPCAEHFRWRQIFIFHYLHPLETDHRQLRYLQALLKLLRDLELPVVSYLTPINYQAGVRYVGEVFETLVSKNVGKILQLMAGEPLKAVSDTFYQSPGLTVADWTFWLTDNFFFHRNEPTEHLNESGRNRLSTRILRLVSGDPLMDGM